MPFRLGKGREGRGRGFRVLWLCLTLAALLSLPACAPEEQQPPPEITEEPKRFTCAVLASPVGWTAGHAKIYNASGQCLALIPIASGGIGRTGGRPSVYDRFIALPSHGKSEVSIIDLDKLSASVIDVGVDVKRVALGEDCFYTASSGKDGTIIKRFDLSEKKAVAQARVKSGVEVLLMFEDKLYALTSGTALDKAMLHVLGAKTLAIIESYELLGGGAPVDAVGANGMLYISVSMPGDGKILCVDTRGECAQSLISITSGLKPHHLALSGNTLFVSHYDPAAGTGSAITALDLASNADTTLTLAHIAADIGVSAGYLTVCDKSFLYLYDTETFELFTRFEVLEDNSQFVGLITID